jgi:hypothetical protein
MHSVTVNEDLSSHVVSEDGTKEFFLPTYNPITLVPFATQAQVEEFARTFARSHPNAWLPFVSAEDRAQEALDEVASANRDTRNQLLSDSDWTQIPDSALTDEAKALWVTYRTALRDLTAHENWPNLEDADWPTQP